MLAVNAWDEPAKDIRKFLKKNKLKQRVLLDGSKVAETYKCDGIPTTFWIDPKGVIQDVADGFSGPGPLEKKTQKLLEGSG